MNAARHILRLRSDWSILSWGAGFVFLTLLVQVGGAVAEQEESYLDWVRERYKQEETRVKLEVQSRLISEDTARERLQSIVLSRNAEIDAYQEGQADAKQHLAAGRLGLLLYGLPTLSQPEYQRLLRVRIGVESKVIAGCCLMGYEAAHADGYNEIMVPAITAKFGTNVLNKLGDEADAAFVVRAVAGRIFHIPLWQQLSLVVLGGAFSLSLVHRKLRHSGNALRCKPL